MLGELTLMRNYFHLMEWLLIDLMLFVYKSFCKLPEYVGFLFLNLLQEILQHHGSERKRILYSKIICVYFTADGRYTQLPRATLYYIHVYTTFIYIFVR